MISDKIKLRKYEDDLDVSGLGVIVLGAWSVVRALIELSGEYKELIDSKVDTREEKMIAAILTVIFFIVIAAIIMKLHLYIGMNAMKAARGKDHKKGYFVAAVIVCIFTILGLWSYTDEFQTDRNIETVIAAMLVDITTIYAFAIVIFSTYKIRKIKEGEIDAEQTGKDQALENTVSEETFIDEIISEDDIQE